MKRLYQCIFLLLCCYIGAAAKKCARGHHFVSVSSGQAICAPCQDGSFMPDDDHTNRTCLTCSEVANRDLEILVSECNRTHDSVILCQTGYYRFKARSVKDVDRCVVCSQCEVPARACQGHSDTICCRPGEICAGKGRVVYEVKGRSRHNASDQVEAFRDLLNTSKENGASCGQGFYTHRNTSNGLLTCHHCSEILSANITNNRCKNCTQAIQLPVECRTKSAHDIAQAEFRFVSILLFSMAVVVDSMYVFLYGRNFLRKFTGYLSRRSCFSVNESRSRIIGTLAIDVHMVFICIHLFGILCEVGVVKMDEEVLWRFTVTVGILTIVLYFFNAVLFVFVKRLFCADVCVSYRAQTTRETARFPLEDAQVFLDNT